MPANWSVILNILLLIGVIFAIGRLMSLRKQSLNRDRRFSTRAEKDQSSMMPPSMHDDIIAVRKVNIEPEDSQDDESFQVTLSPKSSPVVAVEESYEQPIPVAQERVLVPKTVMLFLLAKEKRQFAGYELLQTVLASGLRFGEGHLFHRHQFANGQGPVLCSLAAATKTGVFDLQNIGAFSVRGLCLFMQTSQNSSIDAERFEVMMETAKLLCEGMDAILLDDERRPLTTQRIEYYHRMLNIEQEEFA